jgi:hypothetical protein
VISVRRVPRQDHNIALMEHINLYVGDEVSWVKLMNTI